MRHSTWRTKTRRREAVGQSSLNIVQRSARFNGPMNTVAVTTLPPPVNCIPGGRFTNAVGMIFRKIFVGRRAALSNNVARDVGPSVGPS